MRSPENSEKKRYWQVFAARRHSTEAFSHAQLLGGILLPYALADMAYQKAKELPKEDCPGLIFTESIPDG